MYYVWSRLKQMKGEKLLWLMLWKKRKCSIYHQCGRMKEGTSSLCCSFRPCRVVFVPTCMFIHRRSVSLASVCLLHSLSLFSCLFCLIQWLLLWGFVLNSIKGVISSSKVGTGGFLFQAGDCRSYKSHRGTETGGGGFVEKYFVVVLKSHHAAAQCHSAWWGEEKTPQRDFLGLVLILFVLQNRWNPWMTEAVSDYAHTCQKPVLYNF